MHLADVTLSLEEVNKCGSYISININIIYSNIFRDSFDIAIFCQSLYNYFPLIFILTPSYHVVYNAFFQALNVPSSIPPPM